MVNLDKLKESPLFQLSLANKELFHSNFLAFLIEKNPDLAASIFGARIGRILEVKREFNHADIYLKGEAGALVVENKFKDIADRKQLENISIRFRNCENFILLSLHGNNINGDLPKYWREVNYRQALDCLNPKAFRDAYMHALVQDYKTFVGILIEGTKPFGTSDAYIAYPSNPVMKPWIDIRMHDAVMKIGLARFRAFYADYRKKKANDFARSVSLDTAINNGKPTITFIWKVPNYEVQIQIEDTEYRRAVVCKEVELDQFFKCGWFDKEYRTRSGLKYRRYRNMKSDRHWHGQIQKSKVGGQPFKDICDMALKDLEGFRL